MALQHHEIIGNIYCQPVYYFRVIIFVLEHDCGTVKDFNAVKYQ